jgi:UDP-glucose-4-epimerase GalE
MNVLVVGGAGYIGSHVCKALKKAGFTPIVYDNLENGHFWAVQWGPLVEGDLLDSVALRNCFEKYLPIGVIHLASYINARESMSQIEKYYENNVIGSLRLFEEMGRQKVTKLVFSSTAAVYGDPIQVPITEDHPCKPINVYGKTKWVVENLLGEFYKKHGICSVALRYFNAAGADPEGEIGEAHAPETHLIPLAILSALGKNPAFKIFGTDHSTPDGTPIRDYIHVTDLAQAHVLALEWLIKGGTTIALNLGCGQGYSVQEVIAMIEKVMNQPVPRQIAEKNPSDPPVLVANTAKAQEILNWKPCYSDLETIITTAFNWYKKDSLRESD